MKFRASANANDYIRAGAQAAKQGSDAFRVARKYSPDYGRLAEESIKNRSAERRAAMEAQARVAKAGIDAAQSVKRTRMKTETEAKIADTKRGAKRFAGIVGGLGTVAVAGMAMAAPKDKEDNSWKDKYHAAEDKLNQQMLDFLDNNGGRGDGPELQELPDAPEPTAGKGGSTGSTGSKGGNGTKPSGGSTLTGGAKTLADAIAKYESGDWGYEAFNQGGAAGGTKVVGKSGSHKSTFGRSLTDMTLGEIFKKQNTKAQGMNFDQHLKSGGLHAVGRYQFIGDTLQDEVSKMGLSHDTKFTPEVQDQIFLSHIKRVGNISPWVGPTKNYNDAEKANFNSIIQGL